MSPNRLTGVVRDLLLMSTVLCLVLGFAQPFDPESALSTNHIGASETSTIYDLGSSSISSTDVATSLNRHVSNPSFQSAIGSEHSNDLGGEDLGEALAPWTFTQVLPARGNIPELDPNFYRSPRAIESSNVIPSDHYFATDALEGAHHPASFWHSLALNSDSFAPLLTSKHSTGFGGDSLTNGEQGSGHLYEISQTQNKPQSSKRETAEPSYSWSHAPSGQSGLVSGELLHSQSTSLSFNKPLTPKVMGVKSTHVQHSDLEHSHWSLDDLLTNYFYEAEPFGGIIPEAKEAPSSPLHPSRSPSPVRHETYFEDSGDPNELHAHTTDQHLGVRPWETSKFTSSEHAIINNMPHPAPTNTDDDATKMQPVDSHVRLGSHEVPMTTPSSSQEVEHVPRQTIQSPQKSHREKFEPASLIVLDKPLVIDTRVTAKNRQLQARYKNKRKHGMAHLEAVVAPAKSIPGRLRKKRVILTQISEEETDAQKVVVDQLIGNPGRTAFTLENLSLISTSALIETGLLESKEFYSGIVAQMKRSGQKILQVPENEIKDFLKYHLAIVGPPTQEYFVQMSHILKNRAYHRFLLMQSSGSLQAIDPLHVELRDQLSRAAAKIPLLQQIDGIDMIVEKLCYLRTLFLSYTRLINLIFVNKGQEMFLNAKQTRAIDFYNDFWITSDLVRTIERRLESRKKIEKALGKYLSLTDISRNLIAEFFDEHLEFAISGQFNVLRHWTYIWKLIEIWLKRRRPELADMLTEKGRLHIKLKPFLNRMNWVEIKDISKILS